MIVTEIYKGQGLGNQLWCYVVTRVISEENNYKFGIKSPENFKCLDFMNLNFGEKVINGRGPEGGPPEKLPDNITNYYKEREKYHPLTGADIRTYDGELMKIPDNTKIDGVMQDERYILKYREKIKKWLEIYPEHDCFEFSNDNTCIINFRGGEYVGNKELFLKNKYWNQAIDNIKKIKPNINFTVITDDVKNAKEFFPNFNVYHFNIAKDYTIIKNAKYLIMSNSSFAWFPAWLNNDLKFCIAPKYWARHNVSNGYWSTEGNITKKWNYQDRNGKLFNYDECLQELEKYKNKNKFLEDNKLTLFFNLYRKIRNIFV